MSAFKDLAGMRFGRLTAIRVVGKDSSGRYKWQCKCDCGGEKVVAGVYLTNGGTRSCGCLHSEAVVKHNKSDEKKFSTSIWNSVYKRTHGGHGTRLYKVWSSMRQRCNNPNGKSYEYYGGRGISVCAEWDDFDKFRDWAYKNGYNDIAATGECTIDRIDGAKGYSPSNCRWVPIAEQNRNKRPGGRRREKPA